MSWLLRFILLFLFTAIVVLSIHVVKLRKVVFHLQEQNKYTITSLSGGVSNIPKARGELRTHQQKLLQALIAFDAFAKKHNIEYWLNYGTLLGAHRHQGFIPWDDDVDIGMTLDNLDKLKMLANDASNHITLTPSPRNHSKTAADAQMWSFTNQFGGFDIFTYVFTNEAGLLKQRSYVKWISYFRKLIPNSDSRILAMYDSIKISEQDARLNNNNSVYLTYRARRNGKVDEGTLSSYFKFTDIYPLVHITFEGHEFPVPNNVESYLSTTYGDFRTLPNRFGYSHHFGEYKY